MFFKEGMLMTDETVKSQEDEIKEIEKAIKRCERRKKVFRSLFFFSAIMLVSECGSEMRRSFEKVREQEESKKSAALVDKQMAVIGKKMHAHLFLNADEDPTTAEALVRIKESDPRKIMAVRNLTNGTVKTMAEWRALGGRDSLSYPD